MLMLRTHYIIHNINKYNKIFKICKSLNYDMFCVNYIEVKITYRLQGL